MAKPRPFRPLISPELREPCHRARELFGLPWEGQFVDAVVRRALDEIGDDRGETGRFMVEDQLAIQTRVPSPLDAWLRYCTENGLDFYDDAFIGTPTTSKILDPGSNLYLLDIVDAEVTVDPADVWYLQPEALRGFPVPEEPK